MCLKDEKREKKYRSAPFKAPWKVCFKNVSKAYGEYVKDLVSSGTLYYLEIMTQANNNSQLTVDVCLQSKRH